MQFARAASAACGWRLERARPPVVRGRLNQRKPVCAGGVHSSFSSKGLISVQWPCQLALMHFEGHPATPLERGGVGSPGPTTPATPLPDGGMHAYGDVDDLVDAISALDDSTDEFLLGRRC